MEGLGGGGDGDVGLVVSADLLGFDAAAHDVPEVQLGAGADVAAEAEGGAAGEDAVEGEEAAAEEEVGGGAVDDGGSAGGDGFALAGGEVEGVGEEGAGGEEAEGFVDFGVVLGPGVLGADFFDFFTVFGEVGLEVGLVLPGEVGGTAEEFFAATGGEARGEGVFEEAVVGSVPLFAEAFAFEEGDGGDFFGLEGAVAGGVDHGLAHDDAQPGLLGGGEGGVAGVFVDAGVEEGGGGAVAGEFGEEGGGLFAAFGAGEVALQGEDVFAQPGEEVAFGAGDGGVLGEVGVKVDEAGQDEPLGVVDPPEGLGARFFAHGFVVADFGDVALIEDEGAVAPDADFAVFRRVDQASPDADEFGVHRGDDLCPGRGVESIYFRRFSEKGVSGSVPAAVWGISRSRTGRFIESQKIT